MHLKELPNIAKRYFGRLLILFTIVALVTAFGSRVVLGPKIAVARALAMTPPLVLADEPTGNLDSQSAEAVFTLFRKVNREQGTAILFVTHNAALAERCDKIIQVVDGKLMS